MENIFLLLHMCSHILCDSNIMTDTLLSLWILLFSFKECGSLFWQAIKLVADKLEPFEACF